MKLDELENKLGITFPQKFHEIYQTGAMKWLEISIDQLKEKRLDYINDKTAFLMLNCDCELYLFDEIPDAINELNEYIKWQEDDEEVSLSEDVTLIPFGHGNGDMYCFMYKSDLPEPQVILYAHDDYDDPEIIGHTFDEFIYIQMLDAVANDEDIDGMNFKNNMKFLSEKYHQLIFGKSVDSLISYYDNLSIEQAEIWK